MVEHFNRELKCQLSMNILYSLMGMGPFKFGEKFGFWYDALPILPRQYLLDNNDLDYF